MRLAHKEPIRKMRNKVITFFSRSKPNPDIEIDRSMQEYLDKGLCDVCERILDETFPATDIMRLLKAGANPSAKNKYGKTPLMFAAFGGHYKIAKALLKRGAYANARNIHGETAMMAAIQHGDRRVISLILEKGAEINIRDNKGRTALMRAAWKGDTKTCSLLIGKGANIGESDIYGKTALAYAKENNEKDTVAFLSKLTIENFKKAIGEESFDLFMLSFRECVA